jgi:hypothetical protein
MKMLLSITRRLSPARQTPILATSIAALLALGLAPSSLHADSVVVGAGPGGGPQVTVFDAATDAVQNNFFAFSPTFTGGVNVAAGDGEIIVGSGKGGGTVSVFNTSGTLEDSFTPFGASWTGGVSVAVGDGKLIVGAGASGQPEVSVYGDSNLLTGGTPVLQTSFDVFPATFKGGVSVAIGDGKLVVGEGSGGSPTVSVYNDSTFAQQGSFLAFSSTFTGGVSVAVANGTLAVGAGSGGGPQVNLYNDASLALQNSFFAFAPSFTGGVKVALNDGLLAVGAGAGGSPQVNVYSAATLSIQSSFLAFTPTFKGGTSVAILPVATTWNGTTSDWNTASNWSTNTVPNSFNANAIFGSSGTQSVSLSANTEVNSITFNASATSPYTLTVNPGLTLTIGGTGISNTSGVIQNFVTGADGSGNVGSIIFRNNATAGTSTNFTNNGGPAPEGGLLGRVACCSLATVRRPAARPLPIPARPTIKGAQARPNFSAPPPPPMPPSPIRPPGSRVA